MYSWICSILTLYYLGLFYFNITADEEENDDDIDYTEEASNLLRPLKFIFVINLIHLLILTLS